MKSSTHKSNQNQGGTSGASSNLRKVAPPHNFKMKTQIFQRIFFITTLLVLTGLWIPRLALAAWPGDPTVNVLICTDPAGQQDPKIASDGSGGAIIIWTDARDWPNRCNIYAQRVDANGNIQWTTDGVPICTAPEQQRRPKIVSDGSGGAIITWSDMRNDNWDIYAQRVDSDGAIHAGWTTDGVPICTDSNLQLDPTIVSDGSNGAIITWKDERNDWKGDIYAQRIDASGLVQWTTDGVPICTASGTQMEQTITSDGSGGAIITWEDYRGNGDIYAQRVFYDGSLQGPPHITVNPIDFGDIIVGKAKPLTVSIGNSGGGNLNVTDITSTLGGILEISETAFTVAPGATHEITLTLTASDAGEITGILTITSNDPNSPTEVSITGDAKFHVGDLSGDGSVSAYDAALILKFVVGIINEFPVESMISNSPENALPRDYEVSIPQITLKAGHRVFVPVNINDATGLVAGGLTLKYDATVLRAIDVTFPIRQSYWEANTDLDGEVRFAFVNANGTTKADKLLLIEFEALPNSEGKTSALILDDVQLSGSLFIQKVNGLVTVSPSEFRLRQNYPNPFNPETWIPYRLSEPSNVRIHIYNMAGQLVRTLNPGYQEAGLYESKARAAYWDGKNDSGGKVANSLYFYRLEAGEFSAMRKMVLVK